MLEGQPEDLSETEFQISKVCSSLQATIQGLYPKPPLDAAERASLVVGISVFVGSVLSSISRTPEFPDPRSELAFGLLTQSVIPAIAAEILESIEQHSAPDEVSAELDKAD